MLSLRSPGHHFSRYRSILLALAVCFTFTITFTWYYVTGTKQYPLKDYAASARPAPLYVGHHYSNEAITPRANACFVILTRNRELDAILSSLQHLEMHFNSRYHYPFVLLNDEPFTEDFQAAVSAAVSGNVSYGLVPQEHWLEPAWIDQERAAESRKKMKEAKVIYGGNEAYRRMCRYQSGFFFRHELLQQYDWYWRVEPGIRYSCDINYDPFLFMQQNNKAYGFTISMKEYSATIPTLWDTVKDFTAQYPEHVHPVSLKLKGGALKQFWSNFEIASLDFLRSQAYMDYFEHLDRAGGFSYERWGDAPVHSIAAALFLDTRQLHFFDDIGYYHLPFTHCPSTSLFQGCFCDPEKSFDNAGKSCMKHWHKLLQNKGLQQ